MRDVRPPGLWPALIDWIHDRRQGFKAYLRARGLAPQRRGNYAAQRYTGRRRRRR